MSTPTDIRRAIASILAGAFPLEIRVAPGPVEYANVAFDTLRFNVTIVAGPIDDPGAHDLLDDLIAATGARSVKQLLEIDRKLGGLVSDLDVPKCTGAQTLTDGDTRLLAATWTVQVLA